jgi:signal transduction histidine kinase
MDRVGAQIAFLSPPGGLETVRAFSIFAVLLAVLIWAAHAVAFDDMSQLARTTRMHHASEEARRVAEAVTSLGRGPAGMDFYRLRKDRVELERFLSERLADRPDLRFVEVVDRFGVKLATVPANANPTEAGTLTARVGLMVGGAPQGEVRVGVATEAVDKDIELLRRWLRIKVALVAALGVGLLAVALGYSFWLIKKNRALEHARQSSERRAYRVNLGSGLAHEIRNPLNSITINLQMLEEDLQGVPGLAGGEDIEMLRSMQGEIKRIKNLIDAFLEYSRPASPQFEVKDLNEVMNATAKFLQADFRQSGIELILDLEPLLPSVAIDEGQLRQALLNILGNARHVTPAGGRVSLSTRAGMGGEVVIEVADTGPGIPRDTLDKIFEPFFSRRAGGTGLGLAIARQMVDNHNGRIEVESQLGQGTTFRIRLPRRHARAAEPPPSKASR